MRTHLQLKVMLPSVYGQPPLYYRTRPRKRFWVGIVQFKKKNGKERIVRNFCSFCMSMGLEHNAKSPKVFDLLYFVVAHSYIFL